MQRELRSNCPVAATLDLIGDRWTMLVLRDMLLRGRTSFNEFASNESIATNILASRLSDLVNAGIIERTQDPDDGRKVIYRPLRPAVDLLPVISEVAAWGVKHTAVEDDPETKVLADPDSRSALIAERTRQLEAQLA